MIFDIASWFFEDPFCPALCFLTYLLLSLPQSLISCFSKEFQFFVTENGNADTMLFSIYSFQYFLSVILRPLSATYSYVYCACTTSRRVLFLNIFVAFNTCLSCLWKFKCAYSQCYDQFLNVSVSLYFQKMVIQVFVFNLEIF